MTSVGRYSTEPEFDLDRGVRSKPRGRPQDYEIIMPCKSSDIRNDETTSLSQLSIQFLTDL